MENEASPQATRIGRSSHEDPTVAVKDLVQQLEPSDDDTVIFYCSSSYDTTEMEEALGSHLPCHHIGCTTAGEISGNYFKNTIVGVMLSNFHFRVQTLLLPELTKAQTQEVNTFKAKLSEWIERPTEFDAGERFLLLLIDGLSIMEEVFLGNLSNLLKDIPLVGGSAGDDLNFNHTHVYFDGKFHRDAAVMALVETDLKVVPFKFQHFQPSERDMVITSADPRTRKVFEIDGAPAAEEYAQILELPIQDLTPQVFSTYPVMLQIGTQWYVRSIQKVNEDGSLTFFCAIDEGLPLTIAKGIDFIETLTEQVDSLAEQFASIELTLGFDCILRRLEIEQKSLQKSTENVLNKINFFGFSTYGEQFNTIHVNQTLTGVALGREK